MTEPKRSRRLQAKAEEARQVKEAEESAKKQAEEAKREAKRQRVELLNPSTTLAAPLLPQSTLQSSLAEALFPFEWFTAGSIKQDKDRHSRILTVFPDYVVQDLAEKWASTVAFTPSTWVDGLEVTFRRLYPGEGSPTNLDSRQLQGARTLLDRIITRFLNTSHTAPVILAKVLVSVVPTVWRQTTRPINSILVSASLPTLVAFCTEWTRLIVPMGDSQALDPALSEATWRLIESLPPPVQAQVLHPPSSTFQNEKELIRRISLIRAVYASSQRATRQGASAKHTSLWTELLTSLFRHARDPLLVLKELPRLASDTLSGKTSGSAGLWLDLIVHREPRLAQECVSATVDARVDGSDSSWFQHGPIAAVAECSNNADQPRRIAFFSHLVINYPDLVFKRTLTGEPTLSLLRGCSGQRELFAPVGKEAAKWTVNDTFWKRVEVMCQAARDLSDDAMPPFLTAVVAVLEKGGTGVSRPDISRFTSAVLHWVSSPHVHLVTAAPRVTQLLLPELISQLLAAGYKKELAILVRDLVPAVSILEQLDAPALSEVLIEFLSIVQQSPASELHALVFDVLTKLSGDKLAVCPLLFVSGLRNLLSPLSQVADAALQFALKYSQSADVRSCESKVWSICIQPLISSSRQDNAIHGHNNHSLDLIGRFTTALSRRAVTEGVEPLTVLLSHLSTARSTVAFRLMATVYTVSPSEVTFNQCSSLLEDFPSGARLDATREYLRLLVTLLGSVKGGDAIIQDMHDLQARHHAKLVYLSRTPSPLQTEAMQALRMIDDRHT